VNQYLSLVKSNLFCVTNNAGWFVSWSSLAVVKKYSALCENIYECELL
jgi:hypothetical protein